ncbi:MAG: N-6 DNA methylase [Candidatus Dadabacteria bacterium]|nr:N-6 DNA methylase [Candidatus Dadabacteria bacterium]
MPNTVQTRTLGQTWKKRLNLATRRIPELYENADDVRDVPHAGAIRTALREMRLSAVFCVQDVPTIAILSVDEYDRQATVTLHTALWNQGLASLLLVISGDTVRAFSLFRVPHSGDNEDFDDRCLIRKFNAVSDALALRKIVYGAESGRLWEKHAELFRYKDRVDQVLLDNLIASHERLCETGLSSDAAQALLIQTMFVAYLEDREIIGKECFKRASGGSAGRFCKLLETREVTPLRRLFEDLREQFNGDLFVAPCSLEDEDDLSIDGSHLEILARFRSGREKMRGRFSQLRFWCGYNFKYIPVELISAVYDRFLGKGQPGRAAQGAYYTPMFLADTVISQVWDFLPPEIKEKGCFLDPACGSGVFLVRSFQRLCEYWRRTRSSQTIRWDSLLSILSRLGGIDINDGAVRMAVFSLYIALLEEVSPPDLRHLMGRGRKLPKLRGETLCNRDFFTVGPDEMKADVLIGNPPWSSRRGKDRSSVEWGRREGFPIPGGEDAWAFAWKSLRHLRGSGTVAFLLPAMGFLHNNSQASVSARKRLVRETNVLRIINFCDLRFQLFEKASSPAALIIYGPGGENISNYKFDYWVPKANINLKTRRLITLTSADRCRIDSRMVEREPRTFKFRLWMSDPEAKLFGYLSRFSKIKDSGWKIGQGFKPAKAERLPDVNYPREQSDIVAGTPHLRVSDFRPFFLASGQLGPWRDGLVYHKGFEDGFKQGPRVLVPRGVKTSRMRLQAAYVEDPLTFQDIINSLVVSPGEERRAKLLAALLNSKLILWFAFHSTASFGSERPEAKQSELLLFPFPSPDDMPQPKQSRSAEAELVTLVDQAARSASDGFGLRAENNNGIFNEVDRAAYKFFCLSKEEVALVEDTVERVIPAAQPHRGTMPEIWEPSNYKDRRKYADTLARGMRDWFADGQNIRARLEAKNEDLAILRLSLEENPVDSRYSENNNSSVDEVVSRLFDSMRQPLPGNFQLIPDLRIFIGSDLYLVKPSQKRFWMKSVALSDAHSIALDLHDAVSSRNGGGHS